eukprot:868255-Amphidinium_carterae.1
MATPVVSNEILLHGLMQDMRLPAVCSLWCEDKRLTKTNFADNNFMKSLESALRFGTPLLVSDVDKVCCEMALLVFSIASGLRRYDTDVYES